MQLILTVNYDDPKWYKIDRWQYCHCHLDITIRHFPMCRWGQAEVVFEIGSPPGQPTTKEVLAWQNEPGYRGSDRAEAETCLPVAQRNERWPIVAICPNGGSEKTIGYILGGRSALEITLPDDEWEPYAKFLRVKEESINYERVTP